MYRFSRGVQLYKTKNSQIEKLKKKKIKNPSNTQKLMISQDSKRVEKSFFKIRVK
jgi:hypothetical protein